MDRSSQAAPTSPTSSIPDSRGFSFGPRDTYPSSTAGGSARTSACGVRGSGGRAPAGAVRLGHGPRSGDAPHQSRHRGAARDGTIGPAPRDRDSFRCARRRMGHPIRDGRLATSRDREPIGLFNRSIRMQRSVVGPWAAPLHATRSENARLVLPARRQPRADAHRVGGQRADESPHLVHRPKDAAGSRPYGLYYNHAFAISRGASRSRP